MSYPTICPICRGKLAINSESYEINDLFAWWQRDGFPFSARVRSQYPQTGTTDLLTCVTCGFGIFYPTWVGTEDFYRELFQLGGPGYYARDTWEHREALQDLSACRNILDVGCGQGRFLERLKARGREGWGLELNPDAVRLAKNHGLLVENLPVEQFAADHQEMFDGVCLFQVLEHVSEPTEFINASLACLKTGGYLILSVPDMNGVLGKIRPLLTNVPPHHVSRWTADTLVFLGQQVNLALQTIKHEPVYDFLPRYLGEKCQIYLPQFLQTTKFWRSLLKVPGKVLRFVKPQGLASLGGHTVYAVYRKT